MYCVWLAEDIVAAAVWPVVVVAAVVNTCAGQTERTAAGMNNVPVEDIVAVSIVVAVVVLGVSAAAVAVAVDIVVDYQNHTVPTSLAECILEHTESTVLNSFQECG